MDTNKLQDLILATEGIDTWDLTDARNRAMVAKLAPKLVEALKETALEVKCPECHGRGYLTGSTAFEGCKRGKCPECKGTGSKYYFLEV
jgi:hypothetical protein